MKRYNVVLSAREVEALTEEGHDDNSEKHIDLKKFFKLKIGSLMTRVRSEKDVRATQPLQTAE